MWLEYLCLSVLHLIYKMQGFLNKLFTIVFENYQVDVSCVTSFCKTATHIASYLKSTTHTHIHTNRDATVQVILTQILT